jgi:lipid A 3-O-deacylase
MRLVATRLVPSAIFLATAAWLGGAPAASAQGPTYNEGPTPLIDEVRLGLLAHSIDPNNAEDGVDVNLEMLFRRPTYSFNNALLDVVLRPRIHLGTSISTSGETSQLYAGFTWDGKLTQRLSLELTFGGSLHDGPTGPTGVSRDDSYGCALNFRESASLGYALDDRWTVYGTIAHMSNADLCAANTGMTSVGVRLGYKLK